MKIETAARICVNCGQPKAEEIRRDEIFGHGEDALIIENVPTIKCRNCGVIYLEPRVSIMIDEICREPERFASMKQKFVATIA